MDHEAKAVEDGVAGSGAKRRWKTPEASGIRGRVRLVAGGKPAAVLVLNDGEIEVVPGDGQADATIVSLNEEDGDRILRGELNCFVAFLQGRLDVDGDPVLAVRTLYALQTSSPLRPNAPAETANESRPS